LAKIYLHKKAVSFSGYGLSPTAVRLTHKSIMFLDALSRSGSIFSFDHISIRIEKNLHPTPDKGNYAQD